MVSTSSTAELDTVTLSNGLTCDIPASSPLAKLLKSKRTWVGPSAKERLAILRKAKSVAIVGASPNPARSSYFVSTYLQQSSDFRLYFVNPNATEILGEPAYASLTDLPEVPDIVVVFRRGSDIPQVEVNEPCPECDAPMRLMKSRFGPGYYLGCSKYPKCKGKGKVSPELQGRIDAAAAATAAPA